MKNFNIILSAITFIAATVLLIADFPNLTTFNGIIFFSLIIVLLLICITGLIINLPSISFRRRNKFSISYDKY
ncbi:hypothetical protein [Flavobacterium sp.]|uniref:hypothetical protein n=1 Tax=Flavobacterium sp. TaxID=239 RepID=UPI002617FB56|nr:hypothetical protein [Flavobacterium sp.]